MIAWFLALVVAAQAAPELPVCDATPAAPPASLSVAWVAPAGKRVGPSGWITVTDVADLRRWASQQNADAARLLRGLGLRRSRRPPKRTWVVAIFQVDAPYLCRPMADKEAGMVGGLATCPRGNRGLDVRDDGCGHALDQATQAASLDVTRIRWRDAAKRGFCVVPLERFLRER